MLRRDDLHMTCGHPLGQPPVEELDIVEQVVPVGMQIIPGY